MRMTRFMGHSREHAAVIIVPAATLLPLGFPSHSKQMLLTWASCSLSVYGHTLPMTSKCPCFPLLIKDLIKAMDTFFPPKYICICVYTFHSACNFLQFTNSFKPIHRYCHPTTQVRDSGWMSAGLLGGKEDGMFSDQLHFTLKNTEFS